MNPSQQMPLSYQIRPDQSDAHIGVIPSEIMPKLCGHLCDDVVVRNRSVYKEQDAEGFGPNFLRHVRERWAVHDVLIKRLARHQRQNNEYSIIITMHIQEWAYEL